MRQPVYEKGHSEEGREEKMIVHGAGVGGGYYPQAPSSSQAKLGYEDSLGSSPTASAQLSWFSALGDFSNLSIILSGSCWEGWSFSEQNKVSSGWDWV